MVGSRRVMTKLPIKKKRKKLKKVSLSASERAFSKLQRDHKSSVRAVFFAAGFRHVSAIRDREFVFENQKSDLDDVFIFENVFLCVEYTCNQSSDVGEHLKQKKIVYDKILANHVGFIDFLKHSFPEVASQLETGYHSTKIVVRLVYCSRYDFDVHYKENVPGPVYLDYPALRYFLSVANTIKRSCRFELLDFLRVESNKIGNAGSISVSTSSKEYVGLILPEAHSHFDEGYKIVTFYADPEALLKTAYVLRKDGWSSSVNLYQRMISKKKIDSIRLYLKKKRRVFINNIIVTLPSDVKPLNSEMETINTATLTETTSVQIRLPDRSNSVGLIDGQHRVFAYHETIVDDVEIAQLRKQQNLLVTGIIFPANVTPGDREKFEARLFLEINSTQTSARPELKHAIGLVLEPFSNESIATRVLEQLAKKGPLAGFVEQYFFDSNKLKTASIVSFGLRPLVKTSGADSIFTIWEHQGKEGVASGNNDIALAAYIGFCVSTINRVLSAIKKNLDKERWTTDHKKLDRVLTTTSINSFLICIRILIEKQFSLEFPDLDKALIGLNDFDFSSYHSSQYSRMAEKIFEVQFL
jgi:DGQHR domain-containing protein